MSSHVLNSENYKKGFLLDEELMGGVSEAPESSDGTGTTYLAYVMRHTTGEYLGAQTFNSIDEALSAINSVQRPWKFEKSSGCGGCNDKNGGSCIPGGCGGSCSCKGHD